MTQPFDIAAVTYDQDFVNSGIGRLQRLTVHRFLNRKLANRGSLEILELNCGTGEDALWFATAGHRVLATDISREMLGIAREKVKDAGLEDMVSFIQLDIENISRFPGNQKFDLIFSNFGGLNCIAPETIRGLLPALAARLKYKGRIVIVVMSKNCLWERFYFRVKGQKAKALRRKKGGAVQVNVAGYDVTTWYYSPSEIRNIFSGAFLVRAMRPVGLFVPPSYLGNYFSDKQGLLKLLARSDRVFENAGFAASLADHFLIDLEVIL